MRAVAALLLLAGLAAPAAAAERVVLVRHAEKEAGEDPGLTPAGKARALALTGAVEDLGVTAILVSPTRRTRETAAPAADSLGIGITEIGLDGGLDDHVAAMAWAAAEARGTVLVVGHSNTVPRIAARLLGRRLPDLDEREYDSLFLVLGDRLMRVRYGPEDGFPAAP